jgi:8-oxo-dGTP pyrophosphatase MutT (NUDIX family)
VDEDDDHIIETAIRETQEEIGLNPQTIQVWGPLSPVPTSVRKSNLRVVYIDIPSHCRT